jgi:hypothetical protein
MLEGLDVAFVRNAKAALQWSAADGGATSLADLVLEYFRYALRYARIGVCRAPYRCKPRHSHTPRQSCAARPRCRLHATGSRTRPRRYYAHSFDMRAACISIARFNGSAASSTVPKSAWPKRNKRGALSWRLSIEDPFERHDSVAPHDLGVVLSKVREYPLSTR